MALTSVLHGWLPPGVRELSLARRRVFVAGMTTFVAGLVVALVSVLAGSSRTPPTPPSPRAVGSSSTPPSAASTVLAAVPSRGARTHTPFACARPRSRAVGITPVGLCIPSLRVQSTMMSLGLNADRTVQVPPLSRVGEAGWYRYSAPPGSTGPTVILGHVDSAQYGEGVFFRLGQLHHGDKILVYRADGRVATFAISDVQQVRKSHFPAMKVYGPSTQPVLRLVTCGGTFDASAGRYLDNIIAYGSLETVRAG